MFLNRLDRIIVIANPRCGVANFSRWIKATPVQGAPEWALPEEARALVPDDIWKPFTKIIPVRDPVARFVSAWQTMQRQVLGFDRTLDQWLTELAQNEQRHWPRLFWPQSRWLSCKVDIVLPVRSFAAFANRTQNGRTLSARPDHEWHHPKQPPLELEARILDLYANDIALFNKLPVWPTMPDGGPVFLLWGSCPPCEQKRRALLKKRATETGQM